MIRLPKTLPEPERPPHLPSTAKWLSGEGAGSWFVIWKVEYGREYEITRYSPSGNIECIGFFKPDGEINLIQDYSITYPSNCIKVTLVQGNEKIRFRKKDTM
jgi:hypothetical protein